MPWVRVPAQASQGGNAQHYIFHACKEATWAHCKFQKALGASSRTYDGGMEHNRRTVHVLQLFSCPPDHLTHMVNGIGPNTYLWVFVKGIPGKAYGPFFAIAPPLA